MFLSVLSAGMFTACNDDEKRTEEKDDEIHGINLAYMDTSTTAKEDFFRYVNDRWLDSTEIPGDRTRWGSFDELRQRTDEDALGLLEKNSFK